MDEHGDELVSARERATTTIPRWVLPALAAAGLVIVVLAAVVVVLALRVADSDDGSQTATDESAQVEDEPATFQVAGDITLTSYDGVYNVGGGVCTGDGGYDDISAGAQVVIRNSTGDTLAAGQLGQGVKADGGNCTFSFTIEDVPQSTAPYAIEVSHRGEIAFDEEESEDIHLTLG